MAESAVLYQGYGMQRRAYGEQVVRAGCVLAAMTGNVGKSGGWASGIALQAGGGPFWNVLPLLKNPYYLRLNRSGEPSHPLYLPARLKPIPF